MFNDNLNTIKSVLKSIGSEISDDYDGFIVKELKVSNTLDDNRSSNQTHIAITSEQMDFFPYVRAEGYFEKSYSDADKDLKKYFVLQIPVDISLILGNLITVIVDYQIPHKPLKILSL